MASAEVISRQADGHRQADGRDRQPTEQSRSPLLSLAMFAVDGSVAATKEALEQNGGDVMIVGDLPFLGKLVALLVTGSEKNEIVEFRFGGVVCVERRDEKNGKSPG